jgi:hypothetical protein
LRTIDAADDLVHNARPVAFSGQVRIPRGDLKAAVSSVREAAVAEGIEADADFARALDALERISADAAPIPLTKEVRCDREAMYDALEMLRADIPQWLKEAAWRWKIERGQVE